MAKHFLTKTLEEIDAANNKVTMRQITKVLLLYDCLDHAFPSNSLKYFSIGQKYQNMAVNMFANNYMRERQYILQDSGIEINVEF